MTSTWPPARPSPSRPRHRRATCSSVSWRQANGWSTASTPTTPVWASTAPTPVAPIHARPPAPPRSSSGSTTTCAPVTPSPSDDRPTVRDVGRLEQQPLALRQHRRQLTGQRLVLPPRRAAGRVLVQQRSTVVVGAPRPRAVHERLGEDHDVAGGERHLDG